MATRYVVVVALMALFLSSSAFSAESSKDTRPSACAGTWYPGDAKALAKLVDSYLAAAPKAELPGEAAVLIVPHAGYRYSGPTAAAGFKALEGRKFSRVVLLGPSHQMGGSYTGGAIPTVKFFETPLGKVPLDRPCCEKLLAGSKCFVADDRPHAREHCLEMELPLLQTVLKDTPIVPVVIGAADRQTIAAMAKAVSQARDDKTLLVVSTDFTHYGPNYGYVPFKDNVPERLRQLDGAAIDRILAVDGLGFLDIVARTQATICGRWAVAVALEVFAEHDDVEGVLLSYTTSGALTGDYTNSVSYAAVVLCRGAASPLTQPEQQCLLRLARDQVRQHLATGQPLTEVEKQYPLTARLKKPGAAFVTLTRGGQLRGCIGHVVPVKPLYQSVLENAVSACQDPRFRTDPVTAAEEPRLHVELSVLSRYRQIAGVEEIKVGRDGLIIRREWNQGLLLPQVPVQQKWDRQRYLLGLCQKAGLPADAWKDPRTRIYRFTAQVFGEAQPGTAPESGKE